MKRYLKTQEEIVKELKNGKELFCDVFGRHYKYKMIDGVVFKYNGDVWVMNGCLDSSDKPYVDEPEQLKLEVGKFYKTRDRKKAFVFAERKCIDKKLWFSYVIIGDYRGVLICTKEGYYSCDGYEDKRDLVAPWEE